jgi:uncharacterized coiled-coil DUF342 family protein
MDVENKDQKASDDVENKDTQNNTEVNELKARLAKLEGEAKKAFEKRDTERQRAKEEAEKAAEYGKVIDLLKEEISDFKTRYNDDEISKYKTAAEKYEQYVTKTREDLLSRLPEDKREKWSTLDIDMLQDVVDSISDKKKNIPLVDGSKHKINPDGTSKKWADLSQDERNTISDSDPALAKKLIAEYIKERNTK